MDSNVFEYAAGLFVNPRLEFWAQYAASFSLIVALNLVLNSENFVPRLVSLQYASMYWQVPD